MLPQAAAQLPLAPCPSAPAGGFNPQFMPSLTGICTLFSRWLTAASLWVHLLAVNLFAAREMYLEGALLPGTVQQRHAYWLWVLLLSADLFAAWEMSLKGSLLRICLLATLLTPAPPASPLQASCRACPPGTPSCCA